MTREQACILHADLDAFFASVEQIHDPSLAGRPVIVGGLGPRGVVAAASYEARRFGVYSATPMTRARRLCPSGVFLPPRFDAYAAASAQVQEIFHSFTPLVEPLALDEAFLDVSGAGQLFGDAAKIGELLRERVRSQTGLTVSVGVATTKLVAKLASDFAKPDGLMLVPSEDALSFLHSLPVERLWGVGPAAREKLARLGVRTIFDLAAFPADTLVMTFGRKVGGHLHDLAWNRDERGVVVEHVAKSLGQEETFPVDVRDRQALRREVIRLADRVGARLRSQSLAGRTVTLKVRFPDFHTITRSHTLPEPTASSGVIAKVAQMALDDVHIPDGVRLIGVSVHNLGMQEVAQESLPFDEGERLGGVSGSWKSQPRRRDRLELATDEVRRRFGDGALGPAALMDSSSRKGPVGKVGAERVVEPGDVRENDGAESETVSEGPRRESTKR